MARRVSRDMGASPHGTERRFIFTNADVPARIGHQVTLLLNSGGKPVALVNFSTQQYINLVARRHFELFGAAEVFAFAALLIGAARVAPPDLSHWPLARHPMARSNG